MRHRDAALVRLDEFFNLWELAPAIALCLRGVGLLVVEVVVLYVRRAPVAHEPVHVHRGVEGGPQDSRAGGLGCEV